MMSCDGWKIEVVNWAGYNPRSETKRPTWFRFENDIALGDGFHGLNCEIKWVWVVILSLVSKKNGEMITWNAAYVESISGITEPTQRKAIEIFEKFVRLRVIRTEACETRALRTNVRTNVTNETNKDSPTGSAEPAAPPVPPETLKEFEPVRETLAERRVAVHIQQRWLDAYPDPSWVVRQIKEAALWEATNPTRRKKNFAAFISRWLAKGWDHRPTPPAPGAQVIPPRANKAAADAYALELDNFLAGVMQSR